MRPHEGWALGASFALLVACAHVHPVGPPIAGRLPGPTADSDVRTAIVEALTTQGFVPESEEPGVITARFDDVDGARALVAIHYGGAGYSIEYRESYGLDETRDDYGGVAIDARYHRWMIGLSRTIDTFLRAAPRAPVAPPPTALAAAPMTSGGAVPAEVAPAVPAGYGTAAVAPPPPTSAPAPTTSSTYTPAPASSSGAYGVPASLGPEPAAPPRPARPRRTLGELLGVGLALLAGGWVINWSATLALTGDGDMIGLSFIPLVGPFVQLTQLDWVGGPSCGTEPCYPRWTGTFYPLMAIVQISGLIVTILGASIRVPDGEAAPDDAALAARFSLVPMLSDTTAGALMVGSF